MAIRLGPTRAWQVRTFRVAAGVLLLAGLLGACEAARAQTVIWSATLTSESGEQDREGYDRVEGYGTLSSRTFTYKGKSFSFNSIYSAFGFTYLNFAGGESHVERDLFGGSGNPRPVTLNIGSGSWMSPTGYPVANFGGGLVLIYSSVISAGNTYAVSITTAEPGAPQSLTATDASSTALTLNWSAPSSVGGSAISGYKYRYKAAGATAFGDWTAITNSAGLSSHVVEGLEASTGYTFQMLATNDSGDGLWSDEVTVTTPAGQPTVVLLLDDDRISEDGGKSTVTAILDQPSTAVTTVTVSASAVGPATADDFTLSSNNVLTIAAQGTASTGTVTISAVNNTNDDDDRRVTVSGVAASTGTVTQPSSRTLTIFDDESASTTVTLTVSPTRIEEDAGAAARTVTVTAELDADPLPRATVVTVSVSDGTAVAGTHYTAVPELTFTIAAGHTTGTGTFTLAPVDDSLDGPDVTVTVTGATASGLAVEPVSGLTITIRDDDEPPVLTLVLDPASIGEDRGESTVTATLDRPSIEDIAITVSATPVDPAVADDFTLSGNKTLTITAGQTTSTGTVTITAVDNDVFAPDKRVTVSGEATSDEDLTEHPADVTLTITNDDEASTTVTLTVDRTTVAEDAPEADRTVTVTATLDGAARQEETEVTVSVTGGSAVAGTDYSTVDDFTVTIGSGETSGTATFTLAPVDDETDERAETVVLTGTTTIPDLTVAPADGVTVTITDDDPRPQATLVVTPFRIAEDRGVSTVTATLDRPSGEVTTINVSEHHQSPTRSSDFTRSGSTLTIAAGAVTSTGTVTYTAVDDNVHQPLSKTLRVEGSAANSLGVRQPGPRLITILEDDVASTKVMLGVSPVSVSEGGGARTVTVTGTLDEGARPSPTPVTVSVSGTTAVAGTDYSEVEEFTLRIRPRRTSGSATFTLTPLDDEVDEPAETLTVTGTTPDGVGLPVEPASGLTLTITDDDAAPQVTLVLAPASIGEDAGESTVTATLDRPSTEDTAITVSAAPVSPATTSDFTLTGTTLTIAAGSKTSTGTVTVTAEDNQLSAGAKSVTVSGTASNDQGVTAPSPRTLTITDDESASTKVTLTVSPASVPEDAAGAERTVTVTATLDGDAREEATEVSVSVSGDSAVAGTDYTVVPGFTLTIQASATSATGTFTLAPVDDDVDEPAETVTVTGTAGGLSVAPSGGLQVTITDNDDTPTVTLVLTPASIPEARGESTVTATLDRPSSEATTIEVSATPVSPAVANDFSLSAAKTLTIVAGLKTSTGTVTITAADNNVDFEAKAVTVSGSATNQHGITQPETATLTITDDDETSTEVTLTVSPTSLPEGATGPARTVTVTAALDAAARAEDTEVTVSVAGGTAVEGTDYTAVSDLTLTIDAGETRGTETFTLAPVDDDVDEPDETVTVSGATTAAGLDVKPQGGRTVTITDDEAAPTVTLVLTPASISEASGSSTVTATLNHPSSEETTIVVTAAAGTGTVADNFELSGTTTLTIAAGLKTSTGTVTVAANNNDTDDGNKSVTVSGRAANDQGVTQPDPRTLTITDDDATSTKVTLTVSPASVSEGATEDAERTVTVTARLDAGARSEATEVTVSVAGGTAVEGTDFLEVAGFTVTIAANRTSGTGTFVLAPVDDNIDEPAETVLVSGATSAAGLGVAPESGLTVTIEDDEAAPTVTLVLTPASISEARGESTVTATLDHPSSEETTIEVTATAGTGTVADDFTLSDTTVLTVAARATASTGTVTITAVDNEAAATTPKSVTVSGTAMNSQGIAQPDAQTLTLTDDETFSTKVTLTVSPTRVAEDATGTARTVTVTGTLDGEPRDADTEVTVSVAAGTAVEGTDFSAITNLTLTIVTGDTSGTATFDLVPLDDGTHEPDETVIVRGETDATGLTVEPVGGVTLTIEDDEAPPVISLVATPERISENGGVSTVTAKLSHPSSEVVVVGASVLFNPLHEGVLFDWSSNRDLTIAAGDTASTGTVTVTAIDDEVDNPDRVLTLRGGLTPAVLSRGILFPRGVPLTIEDNEETSTKATLTVSPASVSEGAAQGERTVTVTATLDKAAREADTPVTISVAGDTAVAGTDFSAVNAFTLTIAGGATSGTATFDLVPLDDETDEPDETVTVTGGTTVPGLGVEPEGGLTVTLADDDEAPQVTLALDPDSVSEKDGVSTVTATLDRPSSEETTIAVSAAPVSPATQDDFTLSATKTLTIAAGLKTSTGTVTVAPNDNGVDDGSRRVTVSGTASNDQGVEQPDPKTLTITDDDETSTTVTLTVSPGSVAENAAGAARTVTVTATLDKGARTGAAEVSVSVSGGTATAGTDYTAVAPFTVTIDAGAKSGTGTFDLVPIDDATDEPDETLQVTGTTAASGLTVVPDGGVTLTLANDDPDPVASLVLTPAAIAEDAGSSTVSATLDRPSSEDTLITIIATPVSPASEADFTVSGTTLTILAGGRTSTGTVTIAGVDNDDAESNKRVTVSGTAANSQGVVQPSARRLTITDDEAASTTVTLTVSPSTVAEDATGTARTVTVTATLDGNERLTATPVAVSVGSGTAVEGTDFTQVAGFTVTIAAGDTSATGTFVLAPSDDEVDELDETVLVTGSTTASGLSVAPAGGVPVTIADNDADPVVTLVLTPTSISERDGMSTVTATQDRVSSAATTIAIGATPNSPAVADDISLSATKTLTIAAGVLTSTGTVTITANDNTIDFADKTVTVSGTATNPAGIEQPEAATLTITDDEETSAEVTLTVAPASVSEGAGEGARTVTVTAALDAAARAEDTVVTVSVATGTAVAGTDFSAVQPFAVTIASGSTSGTGTFDLVPLQDTIDEPAETVTVTGTTTVAGLAVKPDGGLTVTIADDDDAPAVTLVLTPDSISENEGSSTVTATLDHASSEATTVTVTASPGTGAVPADYTLSGTTLTIAAGRTASTGTVTVTAVDNNVHAPDKSVTVTGSARNDQGIEQPSPRTLTITENDTESDTVELTVSPASLSEGAGESDRTVTVTATLNAAARTAGAAVAVTVSGGTATAGTDFSAVTPFTVTIDAGETSGTGTFTLAPVDDDRDEPAETVLVRGTTAVAGLTVSPALGRTVTIEDDDDAPAVTLVLTPASITENEGTSTVSATLSHPSNEATTVVVSASAGSGTDGEDFALSENRTLTIAAGATASTGTVTVETVDNVFFAPNKSVTVSGSARNALGVEQPSAQTLVITDDESPTTTVTLTVSPATVAEDATGTARTVTVTATFNGAPRTTGTPVTVSVAGGTAVAGTDWTAVPGFTITVAAESTSETGTFTLAPVDDDTDEPNETVVVTGATTADGLSVAPSDGLTVTLEDNDATPAVTLVLTPGSISENGGSSAVTATLDHPSSEATTVTVSVSPVSPAVEGDYTLSGSVLTIAAGRTESTGTVTIAAEDNDVHAPAKRVTVSGRAENALAITEPAPASLAITENDAASTRVTLTVSPDTVSEGATGTVTVTAALDAAARPDDAPVTVSVGGGTAVAGDDYTAVTPFTFTIVAGQTEGTATFALASLADETDEPDETVLVRGTTASGLSVAPTGGVPVTIADDDPDPVVTLVLTPASISEEDGVSTVSATLDRPSSVATTVTVSTTPVAPAVAGDYTPSANRTLAIAAGATASTGTVTIAARNNEIDAPNREVTVSGSAVNDQGIVQPSPRTLTITDDEATSTTMTLTLSPNEVGEGDGSRTVAVTATLDAAARTTDAEVSVSVSSGTAESGTDFSVVSQFTVTIAAGRTEGTGTFDLVPLQDAIDEPDETLRVSGTSGTPGLTAAPADGLTVTIADDDDTPTATLVLTPDSIPEANGASTVTAVLDHPSSVATTVTVTATPVSPAAEGDYRLNGSVLTIAAEATASTGTVTITGVDNVLTGPTKEVTVSGEAVNDRAVTQPGTVTLEITDDDSPSTAVTLTVTPDRVAEDATGTSRTVTVTATLDGAARTDAAVEIPVTVSAVTAVEGIDFAAVSAITVTIPTGSTSASATFELAPVDNTLDQPDRTVVVRGPATQVAGLDVGPAAGRTVTIADDEATPLVTLALAPDSLAEDGASTLVSATLDVASSEVTLVAVTASPVPPAVADDYTLSASPTLTIAAGDTTSTGTVTVTPVDNAVDAPDKEVTVSGTAANAHAVTQPDPVTLTVTDDEVTSTEVTLSASPDRVAENATGAARRVTVTAAFDEAARTGEVQVTVSVAGGTAVAGTDFSTVTDFTITIASGATRGEAVFELIPLDDTVNEADETVVVTGATAASGLTVAPPSGVTVLIEDDEADPVAALVLTPESISERGGVSTVSATLDRPTTGPTTITVSAAPVDPAVADDYALSGSVLTIAGGATKSTGTVTITAVDNDVAAPAKRVTVSATVESELGVDGPAERTLTITDEDAPSTAVTLTAAPARVAEEGGPATVTVTAALDGAARPESTELAVRVTAGTAVAGTDFTAVPEFTVTIDAGARSGAATFELAPVDNDTDQPDRTVAVRGPSRVSGLTVGPPAGVEVTIADDDPVPVVTLVLTPDSVREDGGSSTVTATLDRASSARTTVTVSATPVSPAQASDFRQRGTTLTIAPGEISSTGTVTFTGADNDVTDGDREVTVSGSAANAHGVMQPSPATLTVADDDFPSTKVTLTVSPDRVPEGAPRAVTVTATLDGASRTGTTEVAMTVSAGTATAGTDFAAVSGGFTVTIEARARSGTGTFTLEPVDNDRDEPDKTVVLNGPATVPAVGAETAPLTVETQPAPGLVVTIADDDERGIALRPATLTVREGESGTWEVALTSQPTGTVTVDVSSGSTDATVSPERLTFPAAEWSTYRTVTVEVADDEDVESDATVNVSHAASGADYTGQVASVAVMVPGFEDDGVTGTVTFQVPDGGVVTVPDGTSATAGVELTLPAGLEGGTVSVRTVEAAGVEEDSSSSAAESPPGFRAGSVLVDIDLGGATLPAGTTATVCLPVDPAVDRPRVWRWDESATPPAWVELDEPEGGSPAGLVCGVTEHFSMFAVASSAPGGALAKSWLARFGRTVAQHVLDGIEERLQASRAAGFEATVAGRRLDTTGGAWQDALALRSRPPRGEDGWHDAWYEPGRNERAVTLRDLVTGSAFRLAAGAGDTGLGALWGRGAYSRLEGDDAGRRLRGDVTTGTLGADYRRGPWVGGAALSHSEADAKWTSDEGDGRVDMSLTGVYPYAGYAVSERLSVWGAAGYGEGELRLAPDEGERAETGLRLTMGAAGVRGTLPERADGLEAAAKADVLYVRTTSEETEALEASEGSARRIRLGLEGGRRFDLESGGSVVPGLEVGVRHDAGDAETGFGVDAGAGLAWSAPGLRLSGEVNVRGLVVHEDDDFEEWAVSGAIRHEPRGPSGRGLSYSLTRSWGDASPESGAEALWTRKTLSDFGAGAASGSRVRTEAEVGYGFPVLGGRFTGTPHVGLGVSDAGRDYRLGYRLDLVRAKALRFGLGIEGRVPDGAGRDNRAAAPDLRLTGALRW